MCVVSDAWPVPATYHRSFCEHGPEGGSEPLTSAPRSDFVAQSLVWSIDVCRVLGISPLRINIWPNFFRPILAQDLPRNCFLRVFLKVLKLFFRRFVLIASGTDIFWRVSLKFEPFLAKSRFHCHRSEARLQNVSRKYWTI